MATPELFRSWARAEAFLRDAKAEAEKNGATDNEGAFSEFENYIDHNELGLALGVLESIVIDSHIESRRGLELLALAAASMELFDRQRFLDERIGVLLGRKFETRLPRNEP